MSVPTAHARVIGNIGPVPVRLAPEVTSILKKIKIRIMRTVERSKMLVFVSHPRCVREQISAVVGGIISDIRRRYRSLLPEFQTSHQQGKYRVRTDHGCKYRRPHSIDQY
jgi:hypothetical protein